MNEARIRRATLADIPAMLAIESASPTAAHWPESEYARLFDEGSPRIALVLEIEGQVAGFLVARSIFSEWELENVVVELTLRQRGFGRMLISALLQFAQTCYSERILLEVRESNTAARTLYSQFGFQEAGRRPSYYTQPVEDAITYELLLNYDQNR